MKAVGIVEVNNYEISNASGGCGFRGVFPVTSLLSHSCVPNASLAMRKTGSCRNSCVAAVDIEAGEEITIGYVPLSMCSSLR